MLFHSLPFALFAAVVFPVYYALGGWSFRLRWLLIVSWCFYATWSPRFLLLLIATTWVDFEFAKRIHAARTTRAPAGPKRARRLVVASLVMNLGVLSYFKYGRFVYEQIAALVPLPPAPTFIPTQPPLGISFYTFHSISYIVDTFRGLRPPSFVFRDFALYVAFFPQLIAGPISRWSFLGPQIQTRRSTTDNDVERGLFLIAKGLVKKVVLADSLGGFVDGVYAHPDFMAPVEIALALYAYTFQIYFDFSGYTDIALGVARCLGFRLPHNFRHPYRAASPREYWQRWHISLSTWLRDYVYIPLGGNRGSSRRTYLNLFTTMLLGGLWHGAGWGYILWGVFHGAWLVLHRWATRRAKPASTPRRLRQAVTFHLVVLSFVLFRAPTLDCLEAIVRGLFVVRPMSGPFPVGISLLLLASAASHAFADRMDLETRWLWTPRFAQGAILGTVIFAVGVLSARTQRFIYFQF